MIAVVYIETEKACVLKESLGWAVSVLHSLSCLSIVACAQRERAQSL